MLRRGSGSCLLYSGTLVEMLMQKTNRFVYVENVNEVLHEVFKGTEVAERWKDTLPVV